MADNNNDENNNNNNDGDTAPPSDTDTKALARAQVRASRPGAVAVAADEAARLDQRIADKQRSESGPTPAALNRFEQDVQAKSQASVGSGDASRQKPGAYSVSKRSVSEEQHGKSSPRKAHADLEALEEQIAAKTRAATSETAGGQAALESLEDRIQAKVRGEASSRSPPAAAAHPSPPSGAVMSMEERIQAKIRRDGGGSSSSGTAGAAALERLQSLEDRITAKQQQHDGSGPLSSGQREVSRLDERIAAKNATFGAPSSSVSGNVGNLKAPPPESASAATVVSPAGLKKGEMLESEPTSVDPMSKKTDDYPDQGGDKVDDDEYNGGDPLANPHHGGSDVEYGVYDATDNPEGLAVAVPVMEEDDDVFIPSAVEYDPDAKPPVYRNRRFRLYAYMAALVLALILVGVGVGIHFSKDDEYDPTKAFAHREKLGIQEAIEKVVGAENLEDETSPYSKALRWIMYQDPLQLLPESPNFVQRFILAYVYHATSVKRPWSSCSPPDEEQEDSCMWDQLFSLDADKRVQLPSFRWLSGISECNWAGVFCDQFNQTRSISHVGSDMTGGFPEGVVHLPYLQALYLNKGSLSGPLPKEIGQMKHLTAIDLEKNAFTGAFPQEWWESRSLQRISVGTNRITGKISERIQDMHNAKRVYLSENLLTGIIPTVVGRLNSLSDFRVDTNFLQGTIPTEIGLFRPMRTVWMHKNDLSGTIPSELGNCPQLDDIRVASNARLTGEIPGEVLSNLYRLEAFNCNFFGDLTEKFLLMEQMRTLKIHNNRFEGTIPENLGEIMPYLTKMWISGNDFTGSVPDSVCDLAGLYTLSELVADCAAPPGGTPEIFCPKGCCTECCDVAGENCL